MRCSTLNTGSASLFADIIAPIPAFPHTPARVDRWTPDLGGHNIRIFPSLLGLAPEEVKTLQAARATW